MSQILNDIIQIFTVQIRHTRNTASPGYKAHLHGSPGNNVRNALSLIDQITQIVLGNSPEHNLNIGKAEIRIQYNNPFPHLPELNSQVYRGIGFAHTALAAGNGNNPGQCFRLLSACF